MLEAVKEARANVRRYKEELVSILRKHGYNKTLDEFVSILDNTYRSTTKGEVKDIYGFWKVLSKNLGMRERPILLQELTELRKKYVPTRFRLYDNVISVLSALRKKYKLALVSNCFVGLSDILKALDLTRFFGCIILSYEVGVMKLDRRIYSETSPVITIKETAIIDEAAKLMAKKKVRKIPVMSKQKLVGIVTFTDIVNKVLTTLFILEELAG